MRFFILFFTCFFAYEGANAAAPRDSDTKEDWSIERVKATLATVPAWAHFTPLPEEGLKEKGFQLEVQEEEGRVSFRVFSVESDSISLVTEKNYDSLGGEKSGCSVTYKKLGNLRIWKENGNVFVSANLKEPRLLRVVADMGVTITEIVGVDALQLGNLKTTLRFGDETEGYKIETHGDAKIFAASSVLLSIAAPDQERRLTFGGAASIVAQNLFMMSGNVKLNVEKDLMLVAREAEINGGIFDEKILRPSIVVGGKCNIGTDGHFLTRYLQLDAQNIYMNTSRHIFLNLGGDIHSRYFRAISSNIINKETGHADFFFGKTLRQHIALEDA